MNSTQPIPSARSYVFVLYSVMALVIVASFLLVYLMGFGFFFFTPEGLTLSRQFFSFPVLILFLFGFVTPPLEAGAVFSFVWVFFAACFLAAWKWRESFHHALRGTMSGKARSVFSNFLFAMPLLSSMSLTAALAIIYSQLAVGIETGEAQLPPNVHEAFLNLAYAPLIEEVAFRLVPIGATLVLYVFAAGKNLQALSGAGNRLKLLLYAFIYPEGAKRMAGLRNVGENGIWRGISPLEWFMIVITSALFGLAHVLSSGGGWELGKITSASVQGLFAGVTYVAYGFEAPVLLHWYFNYYFYFFNPEIADVFFPGTIYLLSSVEILILVLGVAGWAFFAFEGVNRWRRFRRLTPTPTPVAVPPPEPPSTSPQQSL